MIKGRIVWVIALLALVAAACGAGLETGDGDPSTAPAPDTAPVTSLEPVGTLEPVDPGESEPDPGAPLPEQTAPKIPRALQPFADAAVADLAQLLDVDASTITVAVAESVVWPDGALGCPQPGMAYIQVEVEGSRAVLVHGNIAYHYHGGEGNAEPFLCRNVDG